nr:hypothetical protein [Acidobacteriota bacterium]
GSDVWIKVSLTNTSDQDVYEGVGYADGIGLDSTFRFEVRDEHGKVIPTYPPPKTGYTGRPLNRTISPRQTLTQEQVVSALYDMRKPGKYTIRVSRRASDNPKDGEIKSNIITVTVIPKDKVPVSKPAKVR